MIVYTYKFAPHSDVKIEDLSDSLVARIKVKVENGIKLTDDEKLWLTSRANEGISVSRGSVPLMGWAFDFSDYLRRYVYLQYGRWEERWAPDKTTLRKSLIGGSQIKYILEVK